MFLLTEMTWPEVKQALNTVKLAIIPVGAHEQHGPHMKESCDAVLATEMSKRLAERLHPFALVTPTVNFGVSHHHANFPGTISLQPETLICVLRDMVVSLKHHGISRFLFLNAHGGNQSTLSIACHSLTRELNVEIYYAKTTASAKNALKRHVKSPLYGHSCEREVSEALYLAPHLVHMDRLEKGDIREGKWRKLRPGNPVQGTYSYEDMTANGCIGDAPKASAEAGKAIVEEALDQLTTSLSELLNLTGKKVPCSNCKKSGGCKELSTCLS
ncbi:creatininase family protein [Melghirimyces profundicolus]